MRHLPIELEYLQAWIQDRLRRSRDDQEKDAGLNTLEMVVIAAIIVPAALAFALFIVGKIKSYQSKIK